MLAVALSIATACAPEDAPQRGPRRSAAVELEAIGEWPDSTPVVVQRFEFEGPELGGLSSSGAPLRWGEAKGNQPAGVLIPVGRKPFSVTIPRSDDAPFDTVRLVVSSKGYMRLLAATGWKTSEQCTSEYMERQAPIEPVLIEMSFTDMSDSKEVTLFFEQLTHDMRLHEVQLVRRPVSATVPDPTGPVEYVVLGDESRPARGLLPGVCLEGPVLAEEGTRFVVYAGLTSPAPEGSTSSVALTLEATGRPSTRTVVPLGVGWSKVEIAPLAGSGQGDCLLRIESEGGHPVVVTPPVQVGLERREERPETVLLITSDTHRADFVGFSKESRGALTPMLDSLAARGTIFHDAISSTSITNPSHASIFTGLSVRDTGVVGNVVTLSDRAETLAESFQAAGYRTVAAVSARHLVPWRSGLGQGFEVVNAPGGRMTRDGQLTTDAARGMFQEVGEDEDVFIWLHLFDVHTPYQPHEGITEQYYTGDPFAEKLAAIDPRAQAKWDKRIRDAEYLIALYKGEVSYLDSLVGDLLADVPRLGQGLIAFTADHGEALGELGLYWKHTGLYPNTLRVPLFLVGPGVPVGQSVSNPVQNAAIARTLHGLALAGEGDGPFIGRSLLDEDILEGTLEEPRYVVGANALSAGAFAGRWYLLLHLRKKGWGNPPGQPEHSLELYDLDEDPDCLVNVAAEHPEVLRGLRRGLVRWLASADASTSLAGGAPTGAAATADVAALGYATGESSTIGDRLIDPDCNCPRCVSCR